MVNTETGGKPLKIIGAGLPRTATLTLKVALEMLGAGPCYHMVNILADTSQVRLWADAHSGQADWGKIYAGFGSTVDYPGSYFYKEIMEAFPEAIVVLSVRDGDAWARSFRDTIWRVVWGDSLMRDLAYARSRVDPGWQGFMNFMPALLRGAGLVPQDPTRFDMAHAAAAMERHNAEVRRHVPADRLVVWSPADGWGPLCETLGVPVPAAPLPHANDSRSFEGLVVRSSLEALNAWHAGQPAAGGPGH